MSLLAGGVLLSIRHWRNNKRAKTNATPSTAPETAHTKYTLQKLSDTGESEIQDLSSNTNLNPYAAGGLFRPLQNDVK